MADGDTSSDSSSDTGFFGATDTGSGTTDTGSSVTSIGSGVTPAVSHTRCPGFSIAHTAGYDVRENPFHQGNKELITPFRSTSGIQVDSNLSNSQPDVSGPDPGSDTKHVASEARCEESQEMDSGCSSNEALQNCPRRSRANSNVELFGLQLEVSLGQH